MKTLLLSIGITFFFFNVSYSQSQEKENNSPKLQQQSATLKPVLKPEPASVNFNQVRMANEVKSKQVNNEAVEQKPSSKAANH